MLSVLTFSWNAIAPILLLILLGYYGKQSGMLDAAALKQINRFNFRFGFSALMFVNLYEMETAGPPPWKLIAFILLAVALLTALGWLCAETMTAERSRKAVLIMSSFRSNYAIIGLPLAEALAGRGGLETGTILQLPTVLYFNLVSILVLSFYSGTSSKTDFRKIAVKIGKNPLILGLLAGGAALFFRSLIPAGADGKLLFSISGTLPWLYSAVKNLSRMSTPLALIVLGGQLELRKIRDFRKELIAGVALRLLASPLLGFGLAFGADALGVLSLDAGAYGVMTALFATPMAVASVVMSAEMGSDEILCGQIVVWSSLLSMGSMFAITAVLRALGLV